MRLHVLRLIPLLVLGALSLGPVACQSSTSAKASRQQEARKRLLQKRREAIVRREQREQELQDAKAAADGDLKPDPSMIPSLR
jgi:hypothetical protein